MKLTGARLAKRDELLHLRRINVISAQQYNRRKGFLEKKEATIQGKKEVKKEVREVAKVLKKREAKETKNFYKNTFNKIKKNETSTFSLTDIDSSLGFRKFIDMINKFKQNLTMTIGGTTWVFNDSTRYRLLRLIKGSILEDADLHEDSWGAMVKVARDIGDLITIKKFHNTSKYKFAQGAFFKYTHNTLFNFERYGIYKTGEQQNHEDTCLIVALRNGGISEEKIETIKLSVKNRIIPRCALKGICEKVNIKIILKFIYENSNHHKQVYGTSEEEYVIGLIDEHYFLVEKTEVTSYCLLNYDEVKDEKDFNKIFSFFDGYYKRSNNRFIDSFDVVKCLLQNKSLLKEISMEDRIMASTQFYSSISDVINSLEYNPKTCIRPVEKKKWNNKKEIEYENLFFDFETYTHEGVHIPYLVRCYNDKMNKVFYGEDSGLQFLRSLKKNTRLIAHNANYDYRFLIHHIFQIEELSRGSRLIGLSAKFGSKDKFINIQIKDSYHLISKPLRDFPKTFGLNSTKEIMPYDLYKKDTLAKRFININYVLENFIIEKDREQFLENIKRWNLQVDDTYDIIEYSSRYCELDCIILAKGYNIFRKMMLDCVKLDIDNILTIASLAHQYFINDGCYEGVNEIGGVPQLFIQGTVVGGRTMTSRNEKIILDMRVNDFDAVSLYPSAMARLEGFLKGIPKVITNLSYDDLKTKDGYFVDVIVKSVGIERAFPLMSYKTQDGVRLFTNDMIGKTIRIDKITLEDLIEFHQITFDIVRGYYFDEGFNVKIKETIKYVFDERLKQKKLGNPSQEIYKLIMNSGYGKSIMKPVETDSRFFDHEDEANVFISRQYNWIESFVKFGTKTKVNRVKPLIDHFNICHVGTMILSMSKRIMNEVMCLAEDNNLDLYYQDTDSIHIKDKDISTLSNVFEEKYERKLIGKNMGQFHSDFDLKGCTNVFAKRSIFLGKKSYIDELEGTNDDGQQVTGFHVRMKGIPESCLTYTSLKNGYKNLFDMYEALLRGVSIVVDLTNDGRKANFKMGSDYSVKTLSLFNRTMKF